MIEFNGLLSDKCKIEIAKMRSKNAGIIFSIVTVLISLPLIVVGILHNTWIYTLAVTMLFVIISIFAFITPTKRILSYKIPTSLIIENDMICTTAVGGKNPLKTKAVSKVKKVLDVGEYYIIIFNYGDVSNAWVCQKDLIIKGTIEEFEKLFEGKIKRNFKSV